MLLQSCDTAEARACEHLSRAAADACRNDALLACAFVHCGRLGSFKYVTVVMLFKLTFLMAACLIAYHLGIAAPKNARVVYRFLPRRFDDVVLEDGRAMEAFHQY